MRLLHTSDWHIGRTFHNAALLEDQAYILNQIVDIAVAEQVDVIIVAGDIYDRSVPPATAVTLLNAIIQRIINEHHIKLIIISGNHDSAQRLAFASQQLQRTGLYILGELTQYLEPVTLTDQYGEIDFWGIPYTDPASVRSELGIDVSSHDDVFKVLCSNVKDKQKTKRNIMISHCFIDGASESESERPLSIGGADRVSWQHFDAFDYVALGHLHGRQFKGTECIRYSGSPLKYSFSEENHIKSVTVVDVDESGMQAINQIVLQPLRNLRSINGALKDILDNAQQDNAKDDYLLIKLTDTHAILDVMGKLREVYPNILHLERPGLMARKDNAIKQPRHVHANELTMFNDFFSQMMDRPLSDDEADLIKITIDGIHRTEELN
ncbi:exonuclease SbcCD subunit D [Gammaproteobacteria bacterium AS21]